MQQRLSNRWLNHELIQRTRPAPEPAFGHNLVPDIDQERYRTLRSTVSSHRRMWQHLATSALLLGSLAFSYIAWSQTSGSNARPSAAATNPSEAGDPQTTHREAVNELRRQNHELHRQLETLRGKLHTPGS